MKMENRNALELLHWLTGDFRIRLGNKIDELKRRGMDVEDLKNDMHDLQCRMDELYRYKETVK